MPEVANHKDEYNDVKEFINRFFKYYYTDRSPKEVKSLLNDNIIVIGLSSDEESYTNENFSKYINQQIQAIPYSLPFKIVKYVQREISESVWCVVTKINIKIHDEDWCKVHYYVRLSFTLHKQGDGYLIDVIHVSEPVAYQNSGGNNMLEYIDKVKGETLDMALGRIISQLIPGGIVSCYLDDNYALKIANDRILELLGYDSFDDYFMHIKGKYINSIHEEDQNIYTFNVKFAVKSGKQCECEYRLRCKDDSYIWVHDVVRRVVGKDGRELIFSALSDISSQVERRHRLEIENDIDALTGIYNRKAARKQIEKNMIDESNWAFFVADLDNFKMVNDIYGHMMGDSVLCYIANEFNKYFGSQGTVCRLGGDEFILFINNFSDLEDIKRQLFEVSENYSKYVNNMCNKSQSSLSIGGVYGKGNKALNQIYAIADNNLYKIKNTNKGFISITEYNEI